MNGGEGAKACGGRRGAPPRDNQSQKNLKRDRAAHSDHHMLQASAPGGGGSPVSADHIPLAQAWLPGDRVGSAKPPAKSTVKDPTPLTPAAHAIRVLAAGSAKAGSVKLPTPAFPFSAPVAQI